MPSMSSSGMGVRQPLPANTTPSGRGFDPSKFQMPPQDYDPIFKPGYGESSPGAYRPPIPGHLAGPLPRGWFQNIPMDQRAAARNMLLPPNTQWYGGGAFGGAPQGLAQLYNLTNAARPGPGMPVMFGGSMAGGGRGMGTSTGQQGPRLGTPPWYGYY